VTTSPTETRVIRMTIVPVEIAVDSGSGRDAGSAAETATVRLEFAKTTSVMRNSHLEPVARKTTICAPTQ